MAGPGIQKAAKLLMALDPGTAGQLLKAQPPETITKIATELVYLDATGEHREDSGTLAAEFLEFIQQRQKVNSLEGSVRELLMDAVGDKKTEQILSEVSQLIATRDPFLNVRYADVDSLAVALEDQPAQIVATVLLEMPQEKSTALIPLLPDRIRADSVQRMTFGSPPPPRARARVASILEEKLEAIQESGAVDMRSQNELRLRNVASILQNLKIELRDQLIEVIKKFDPDTGSMVQNLMVTWRDVVRVADRNLQEALRNVDGRQLALALFDADEETDEKIRTNISERVSSMIDEEAALISSPKAEEIEEAREAVLDTLRQMNAEGNLELEDD